MDAVDGNAIGGLLVDVFGTEMTAASSTCAACGARRPVAELVVYRRAPGTVIRCRTCGSVLMVLVRRADITSVDLSGLADLGQSGSALSRRTGFRTGLHTRRQPHPRRGPAVPACGQQRDKLCMLHALAGSPKEVTWDRPDTGLPSGDA